MEPNSVMYMVGLHCRPDQEEKLNKWYNERHILDLLKFKGVKGVTRYEIYKVITPDMVSPDVKYPKYLAVYEFENQESFEVFEASPERDEAIKEARETWAEDGYERVWRVVYKALKTWKR